MLSMETQRLKFLIERDGMEGALDFARRTLVSYRRHVLARRRLRFDKNLRLPFAQSYLAFKRFILENS